MTDKSRKSNAENGNAKRMPGYMEAAFDVLYLLAALCIGLSILLSRKGAFYGLTGTMALLLAGGDAFHLVPRIRKAFAENPQRFQNALGLGKLITSVTMTIFYVLLWHLGTLHFPGASRGWSLLAYGLALLRIFLCLCPQNRWTHPNPPLKWAVLRNIPFALLGGMAVILFFINRTAFPALSWMWLAGLLSFAFYIPVVLGAGKYPMLGMLMLPKTCMYLWMLWMLIPA